MTKERQFNLTAMLGSCDWPDLSDPWDRALREAVAFLGGRTRPVGIVVAGSVVLGKGDRGSDLDIYVVHAAPWRQRIQRRFAGVPCEMFVNPPGQVERYLEHEARERRPITAHMLATGWVVHEEGGTLSALRERARHLLANPPPFDADAAATVEERYFAASVFEDALDVGVHDPSTESLLLGDAVERMLRFAFTRAGRWLPRRKEMLAALDEFDPRLGPLAREFYRTGDPGRRLELARAIAGRTIAAHGFFEWESEREQLGDSP